MQGCILQHIWIDHSDNRGWYSLRITFYHKHRISLGFNCLVIITTMLYNRLIQIIYGFCLRWIFFHQQVWSTITIEEIETHLVNLTLSLSAILISTITLFITTRCRSRTHVCRSRTHVLDIHGKERSSPLTILCIVASNIFARAGCNHQHQCRN